MRTIQSFRSLASTILVSVLVTAIPCIADIKEIIPPPGSSIVHFGQLDDGVFLGSKPHTEQDFAFLQSQHIKYVLNVKFLPFLSGAEKRMAKRHGITYLSVPMNASFIPPTEKHVNRILSTLRDKRYQPIYLHCVLGRDRTSLIAGLYKIYFQGVTKNEAWQEMKESGFRTSWYLHGLKVYFDKHATKPPPVVADVQHTGN